MGELQNSSTDRVTATFLMILAGIGLIFSLPMLFISIGVSGLLTVAAALQMLIGAANLWITWAVLNNERPGHLLWAYIGLSLLTTLPYLAILVSR